MRYPSCFTPRSGLTHTNTHTHTNTRTHTSHWHARPHVYTQTYKRDLKRVGGKSPPPTHTTHTHTTHAPAVYMYVNYLFNVFTYLYNACLYMGVDRNSCYSEMAILSKKQVCFAIVCFFFSRGHRCAPLVSRVSTTKAKVVAFWH